MAPWSAAPTGGPQNAIPWNPLLWDGIAQFYPWRLFAARTLEQGILPLWNPHQFCGTPFIANSQSAVFYPLNLIFLIISPVFAFAVSARLHLWLAGTFMYLLLRYWGRSPLASFTGGLIYMLCGFSIVWLELPTFLCVAAWLPLLILLADRSFRRDSWMAAFGAGIVLGLILLAGHLQIAFYCLLALSLLWLFHCVGSLHQHSGSHMMAGGWQFLLILALGFALAGPQLLPAMELSSMSHRSGKPTMDGYRAYVDYAMPVSSLIAFLAPDFFGNPADGTFWGPANYAEYCGYIGVFPLILGLIGLILTFRQEKPAPYLGTLGLVAMALALGTPLCALFYFFVPGFGQSGSPARSLILYQFALAALAASGMDSLLHGISERKATNSPRAAKPQNPLHRRISVPGLLTILTLGAAAALGLLPALVIARYGDRINLDFFELLILQQKPLLICMGFLGGGWLLAFLGLRGILGFSTFRILIIALIAADLFAFGMNYNATCPPEAVYHQTEGIRYLLEETQDHSRIFPINHRWSLRQTPPALLPPNSALVYGLFDVAGYDSLYSGRWKKFLNTLEGKDASPIENGNMTFTSNFLSPLTGLIGARFVLSADEISAPQLKKTYDGEMKIYLNRQAFPRAFLVGSAGARSLSETLEILTHPDFSPLRDKVLVDINQSSDLPQLSGRKAAGSARISSYRPTAVEIEVEAQSPGLLLLSDAYYPGWKAFVNGKATPVLRTDYILRSIPVPSGNHRIEFHYEPTGFRLGLYMEIWAIGILAGAISYRAIVQLMPGKGKQAS